MAQRNLSLAIANPMMKFILQSPLHRIASSQIMLITVTGRKSGKQYTTPVNFVEIDDFEDEGLLSVVSHQHRTWWRNLRGGAPVTIVLR
ncbi:MAG: nitroreductase family deazaflavin-dependent oxidoreductase, partial [Caldilineaceae bacterium]|nr:nitroreductase family deazaflavin-dependent oxidoreductase [Caldilineaceae bacterium]